MEFQFLNTMIVCFLASLHFSRNQQSRCTTYTMYQKFIGSLHDDRAKPLWEIERESVQSAKYLCVRRCEKDHRCVGIEICTIGPDLSRCRGCCEWYVIDKDGGLPRNATDGCKYFDLVCGLNYMFSLKNIYHLVKNNGDWILFNCKRISKLAFRSETNLEYKVL